MLLMDYCNVLSVGENFSNIVNPNIFVSVLINIDILKGNKTRSEIISCLVHDSESTIKCFLITIVYSTQLG